MTEINETPVSQTEVNEMLLKASTARRTAESAQEITETAEYVPSRGLQNTLD